MTTQTVKMNFPAGKRVNARIGRFEIRTDQSERYGGEASAPEPFDLFLASIGTCAGIFALNFCESRGLSTDGLALDLLCERDDKSGLYNRMVLALRLPVGFPEKYVDGIRRAMALCSVKRHIIEAPEFVIDVR